MSANNEIVILKSGNMFEVHHNGCVDNPFNPSERTLLHATNDLELAVRMANKFMSENIVEYGLNIVLPEED